MSDNCIGDNREDEEERHDEQNSAKAVEIVAPELLEIHEQEHNQNGCIDGSAAQSRYAFLSCELVFAKVLLPRAKGVHQLVVDDLALVNNLLSLQHNAFCANQSAIHLGPLLHALFVVVSEVRLNIFHEVEPVQLAVVVANAIVLVDEVFVGCLSVKSFEKGRTADSFPENSRTCFGCSFSKRAADSLEMIPTE